MKKRPARRLPMPRALRASHMTRSDQSQNLGLTDRRESEI
jgi:hypothetical protein